VSRVGVVILTHNRFDEVATTVARMCALPEHPPLVVVDNGGSDGTARRLAQDFPGVDVVRLPDNVGAAGRNAGVGRLANPYVAFCDDDTWWSAGALGRAADLLEAHPGLALVSGRVLVGPENAPDPACAVMDESPLPRRPGLPGRPVLGFMCAASMIRRAAFLEVGGFEPRFFLGGEEELLALDLAAAGWALAYVPDVVVHHHPSARRDSTRRRRLLARNALWCAWLRRPWPSAARRSLAVLHERARGHAGLALIDALAGLPWVLRHRRVVPRDVEATLRTLDLETARRRSRH
jgi:GT2 family glycosyltransferase